MTKQQILEALEGLKELTNDNGKRVIDAVKAGVHFLQEEPETRWPAKEEEKPQPPEAEPEVKEEAPSEPGHEEPAVANTHPHHLKKKKGAKK